MRVSVVRQDQRMRVAVLADIHGNLPALEAVLAEPDVRAADRVVLLGDIALGPLPAESLDLLVSLGERAVWVHGNCEREVVTAYDGKAAPGPTSEGALATAALLERRHRDLLDDLPLTVTVDVDGLGAAMFCHATPRRDDEFVLVDSPLPVWRRALGGVEEATVVLGHTHMPFDRLVDGRRVVNPGSVGMSYGAAGACWALLGPKCRPASDGVRRRRWPLHVSPPVRIRLRLPGPPSTSSRRPVTARPSRSSPLWSTRSPVHPSDPGGDAAPPGALSQPGSSCRVGLRRVPTCRADTSPCVSRDDEPGQELRLGFARIREEMGLPESFPDDVQAEAERRRRTADLRAYDRDDLTDLPFLTIDPPGSTDLDQAMHLERRGQRLPGALRDRRRRRVRRARAARSTPRRTAAARRSTARTRGRRCTRRCCPRAPRRCCRAQDRPALLWTIDLDAERRADRRSRCAARWCARGDRLDYARRAGARSTPVAPTSGCTLLARGRASCGWSCEVERGGVSLPIPEQEVVAGRRRVRGSRTAAAAGRALERADLADDRHGRGRADAARRGRGPAHAAARRRDGALAQLRRAARRAGRRVAAGHVVRRADPRAWTRPSPRHAALLAGRHVRCCAAPATRRSTAACPEQATHAGGGGASTRTRPRRCAGWSTGTSARCAWRCAPATDVPDWVRAALPALPAEMADGRPAGRRAGARSASTWWRRRCSPAGWGRCSTRWSVDVHENGRRHRAAARARGRGPVRRRRCRSGSGCGSGSWRPTSRERSVRFAPRLSTRLGCDGTADEPAGRPRRGPRDLAEESPGSTGQGGG